MTTKLPLTINVDYLPNWGVAEGLRELVQNWLDAADDMKIAGEISYNLATNVMKLSNPGAVLSRNALLLGTTSKANREDQRGQFGEGLKLGALALARQGRKVVVRTGSEIWRAAIENHPEFAGEKVLVWTIDSAPHQNGVTVTVSPVNPTEYNALRNSFLHFNNTAGGITMPRIGRILTDADMRGKIFVKGIYVDTEKELKYGYNIDYINVDRDRKMIRSYDLENATAELWRAAMHEGRVPVSDVFDLLADDARDLAAACAWPLEEANLIAIEFQKRYPGIVPVENAEQAADVLHYGVHGRVVSPALFKVLRWAPTIESVERVKARLGRAPKKIYDVDKLDETRAYNLLWAVDQLGQLIEDDRLLDRIRVVEFFDACLDGLYRSGAQIDLRVSLLDNRFETLSVLIHEVSHAHGRDGDKRHVNAIEKLWMRLAERWMGDQK